MTDTRPENFDDLIRAKAEGKSIVCGICKVPINILTDFTGEISFLHSQGYRNHDHDALPVLLMDDVEVASDCDFCGLRASMHWTFTGKNIERRFMVEGPEGQPVEQVNNFGYRWSACATCGPLVNSGDVDGLLTRVRSTSRMLRGASLADKGKILASYANMWTEFIGSIHDTVYHGPLNQASRLTPRLMPKIQAGLRRFWADQRWPDALRKASGRQFSFEFPGVHAEQPETFVVRYPPGTSWPRSVWDNHAQHISAGIATSSLYWISRDFTQLAIMAGKEFDKIEISRNDLPSSFGVMVFEEPIGEANQDGKNPRHINAVSWTLVPQGVWLNLYFQPEEGTRPDFDVEESRSRVGYLMSPNPGVGIEFDNNLGAPSPEEPDFVLTILAAWFLINQPGVAEISLAEPDKKLARAAQRAGRRLPAVQIVDLRRRPRRTRDDTAVHVGHPLKVRVYRKGHWKRQVYGPKRGMRKLIYVSPYIAGPEGAPLKERPPVVKVLR